MTKLTISTGPFSTASVEHYQRVLHIMGISGTKSGISWGYGGFIRIEWKYMDILPEGTSHQSIKIP